MGFELEAELSCRLPLRALAQTMLSNVKSFFNSSLQFSVNLGINHSEPLLAAKMKGLVVTTWIVVPQRANERLETHTGLLLRK